MNVSPLLDLNPRQTTMSLIGRPIYSIKCCSALMVQRHVTARLDVCRVFGVSAITLECQICRRKLEVEVSDIVVSRDWLVESARKEFDFEVKPFDPEYWSELSSVAPAVTNLRYKALKIEDQEDNPPLKDSAVQEPKNQIPESIQRKDQPLRTVSSTKKTKQSFVEKKELQSEGQPNTQQTTEKKVKTAGEKSAITRLKKTKRHKQTKDDALEILERLAKKKKKQSEEQNNTAKDSESEQGE